MPPLIYTRADESEMPKFVSENQQIYAKSSRQAARSFFRLAADFASM